MTEQARQKQRDYYKAWREANKEKIKQYNAKYWERKANAEA